MRPARASKIVIVPFGADEIEASVVWASARRGNVRSICGGLKFSVKSQAPSSPIPSTTRRSTDGRAEDSKLNRKLGHGHRRPEFDLKHTSPPINRQSSMPLFALI